jgi:hypothetical protein
MRAGGEAGPGSSSRDGTFPVLSLLARPEIGLQPLTLDPLFVSNLVLPISDARQALSWTRALRWTSGFPRYLYVFLKFSYSLIRQRPFRLSAKQRPQAAGL